MAQFSRHAPYLAFRGLQDCEGTVRLVVSTQISEKIAKNIRKVSQSGIHQNCPFSAIGDHKPVQICTKPNFQEAGGDGWQYGFEADLAQLGFFFAMLELACSCSMMHPNKARHRPILRSASVKYSTVSVLNDREALGFTN